MSLLFKYWIHLIDYTVQVIYFLKSQSVIFNIHLYWKEKETHIYFG